MSCQVLRCGRPGLPAAVPDGVAAWTLCDDHRAAVADGTPWAVHSPESLLVGADALYALPRVVKRLRARAADTVQVVDGRPQDLVQLDLTIGLEGSTDADRDLRLVLPAQAARALGCGLLELADEVDGAGTLA